MNSDDSEDERPAGSPVDQLTSQRSGEYQAAEVGAVANHKELSATTPDGKAVVAGSQRSLAVKASFFSGPIPQPEIFRQYESICPGAADRILRMSEDEGQHRRDLEKTSLAFSTGQERRGQIFGFILVMTITLIGGGLLAAGISAAGVAMVIGALTTMAGAVIWNRVEDAKQRQLEERQLKLQEAQLKAASEAKDANSSKKSKKRPS